MNAARLALAAVIALLVIIAADICAAAPDAKEGFRWGARGYRDGRYRWARDPWLPLGRRRSPPMWWWRHPGYAAPLELCLPLQNYYDYLYGYPPSARVPYNA